MHFQLRHVYQPRNGSLPGVLWEDDGGSHKIERQHVHGVSFQGQSRTYKRILWSTGLRTLVQLFPHLKLHRTPEMTLPHHFPPSRSNSYTLDLWIYIDESACAPDEPSVTEPPLPEGHTKYLTSAGVTIPLEPFDGELDYSNNLVSRNL